MRQICAWCGKALTHSWTAGEQDISYGICLPCANAVITEVPNNLHDFLDMMQVPVVLVDYKGAVQTANDKACDLFGKDICQIEGNMKGEVFECAHAHLPGGCGNTCHCSGCVIRRSVMKTHATGEGVYRLPALLKQQAPKSPQDIEFLITTEKFRDYVILKFYGDNFPHAVQAPTPPPARFP